jgi:hypothetical protein
MRRWIVAALLVLAGCATQAAQPLLHPYTKPGPFEQWFLDSIAETTEPILKTVPDDVEMRSWQCVGRAFVATYVSADDLPHLDKIGSTTGDRNDPAVAKYRALWAKLVNGASPDGPDPTVLDRYVEQSYCRADYEAFLAGYRREY